MTELAREIIYHPFQIARMTKSNAKKKFILRSWMSRRVFPFCYLDTRNIFLNPTALPNKLTSHTRWNQLVFMIGRILDQHHAQDMEVVVIMVKNGDDDGNDTSLCISTNLRRKIAIRDTAREKSERMKRPNKPKKKK